jgi:hypothetical protein
VTSKTLMALYQEDILDEEVVRQWGTHVSKKYVDKDKSKKVRKSADAFLKVSPIPRVRYRILPVHSVLTVSGSMRPTRIRMMSEQSTPCPIVYVTCISSPGPRVLALHILSRTVSTLFSITSIVRKPLCHRVIWGLLTLFAQELLVVDLRERRSNDWRLRRTLPVRPRLWRDSPSAEPLASSAP